VTDLDKLTLAKTDLTAAIDGYDLARRRLNDQRRGQPGSSLGGGGGRGGGSPVETALGIGGEYVDGDKGTMNSDQAARKLTAMDELVKSIAKQTHLLALLVAGELPRHATDKQRRDVERANGGQDVMCEHCTPHLPGNHLHREKMHTAEATDVKGNLPEPMRLGRWCYDIVRKTGALPTKRMLQERANGQRVMVKA